MNDTSTTSSNAITQPEYWEDAWSHSIVPEPINPDNPASENYFYQVLHAHFSRALGARYSPGDSLIEIGCGGSRWLPYFHHSFGYQISGIDYTKNGIRLAQAILDKAGIVGDIAQGDLFKPSPEWIEHFDVVVSFGLVEHFEDTSQVIAACARYLKPGGTMITLVPTMRGLYGLAYRLLRPEVYSKHIPQSRERLAQAHIDAGLAVTSCEYVLGLPGIISRPASRAFAARMVYLLSRLYWKLERRGWGIPPNAWTSPYGLCIATKETLNKSAKP